MLYTDIMDKFAKLRRQRKKSKARALQAFARVTLFTFMSVPLFFFLSIFAFDWYIELFSNSADLIVSFLYNVIQPRNFFPVLALAVTHSYSAHIGKQNISRIARELITTFVVASLITIGIVYSYGQYLTTTYEKELYSSMRENRNTTMDISNAMELLQQSNKELVLKIGIEEYIKSHLKERASNEGYSNFTKEFLLSEIDSNKLTKYSQQRIILISHRSETKEYYELILDSNYDKELNGILEIITRKLIAYSFNGYIDPQKTVKFNFTYVSNEESDEFTRTEILKPYNAKLEELSNELSRLPDNSLKYNKVLNQYENIKEARDELEIRLKKDIYLLGYFLHPDQINIILHEGGDKTTLMLETSVHEYLHFVSSKEGKSLHPFFEEGFTQLLTEQVMQGYSDHKSYPHAVYFAQKFEQDNLERIYFEKDAQMLDHNLDRLFGRGFLERYDLQLIDMLDRAGATEQDTKDRVDEMIRHNQLSEETD